VPHPHKLQGRIIHFERFKLYVSSEAVGRKRKHYEMYGRGISSISS